MCDEENNMLTATYVFLNLLTEQKRIQTLLRATQRLLQHCFASRQYLDAVTVRPVIELFDLLDKTCRSRSIEIHLIPAIRHATEEADPFIAELELSDAIGRGLLDTAAQWLRFSPEKRQAALEEPYASLELYCTNLRERLAKEVKVLLPLAQYVLSSDDWFAIGVELLSIDTRGTASAFPLQH